MSTNDEISAVPHSPGEGAAYANGYGAARRNFAARERELLEASNRNLERARDADGRARSTLDACERLRLAARALIDDVRQRHPGEDLRCPHMRVLEATVLDAEGDEIVSPSIAWAADTLVNACHGASSAAGWWVDPKTGALLLAGDLKPYVIATKLMLITSEVSEAMEGIRKNLMDDKLPHRPMAEVELADAMIRIADLAGALGYDLGGAIVEKMAFNATREDHKAEARCGFGGKAY